MTARVLNEIFFKNFVYVCSVSTPEDKKGPRYTKLDILFTVLSILTFFSDIATDVIVVTQYAVARLWVYAGMTLFFVLMPSIVVNIFSLRWHMHDNRVSKIIWVANVLQFGVLHRYWLSLRSGLKAERTRDADDFRDLYQHQSDLCMLRLFDSFLESAPQLVLQLYIMVNQEDWNPWTGVSALLSLLSLGWGIAAYGKAMRLYRSEKQKLSWSGLILQTLWRFGTMTSRVTAMVLLACVCGAWTLIIVGTHWMLMTSWLVWQRTDFCPSRWEELAYNAVVGAIYTFCFFNVREGRSRGRVVGFYALIGLQNVGFLAAYCLARDEADDIHVITAVAVVLGSFGIGMYCMALYYRFFHPSGLIYLCSSKSNTEEDLETQDRSKVSSEEEQATTPPGNKTRPAPTAVSASHSFRTLKYVNYTPQVASTVRQWDNLKGTSPSSEDSTISACGDTTHLSEAQPGENICAAEGSFVRKTLSGGTACDEQLPHDLEDSEVCYKGTAQPPSENIITSPVKAYRVRLDLDCSLDESHRWRSEELSFAEWGLNMGGNESFGVTKDRIANRHHTVNYNFRPFVGEGAVARPFRRHCSCLVLSENLPGFAIESMLSVTNGSGGSTKKALQNVKSTPNVRLRYCLEDESDGDKSWSMHNFLAADQSALGESHSSASGSNCFTGGSDMALV